MDETREILEQILEENPVLAKKIADMFCEIGPYELEAILDAYFK